jgi:cold shock CspA family protein
MQGTVLFYHRAKSWGFIAGPDADYFVHRTALSNRKFLLADQPVEFDISEYKGKPTAVNVRVVDAAAAKGGAQ